MYHYKDCNPEDTIKKFKSILLNLGLSFKEYSYSPIDGVWSTSLYCNELPNIAANGKGITEELSIASAYGEFFELLENFPIRWTRDFRKKSFFKLFPDEQIKIKYNLNDINEGVCRDIKDIKEHSQFDSDINLSELKPIEFVPFKNINTNKNEYLPYLIIDLLNNSNGAASGNTYEEACVEAFSEILERYSIRKIIEDKLTPPEISKTYIKENFNNLYNLILKSEEKLNSEIRVYDCSLGQGYPVLCIVSYDKELHAYRSKFGGHPLFEVALERCLTEFYQSYSEENHKKSLINYSFYKDNFSISKIFTFSFLYGMQILPYEFFFNNPSWVFNPWPKYDNFTNKEGFSFFTSLLKKNKYEVYIRNNNWFGVPAVYIYIPSMSFIRKDITLEFLNSNNKYNDLLKEAELLEKNKSTLEIEFLIDYYFSGKADTYVDIYTSYQEEILAALAISLKLYDKAIRLLECLSYKSNVHNCLIQDLKLIQQNVDKKDRYKFLSLLYKDEDIKKVINIWESEHIVFSLHKEKEESLHYGAFIHRSSKNKIEFEEVNEKVILNLKEKMKEANK